MSDKILKALMQLFAIVANREDVGNKGRDIVNRFLSRQLSSSFVEQYLLIFDTFLEQLSGKSEEGKNRKRISVNSVKVLRICTDINKELDQKQKIIVLIRLLEYVKASSLEINEQHLEFLKTVAEVFSIDENSYNNCLFLTGITFSKLHHAENLFLHIDKNEFAPDKSLHIQKENLSGEILFLFFKELNFFVFIYNGNDQLFLNGRAIIPSSVGVVDVFEQGSVIKGNKINSIFYNDILHQFIGTDISSKIQFDVKELGYSFRNNKIGLYDLTFSASSGTMVSIMGNSGAGKTTLLTLLNGSIKPTKGNIYINGTDLHSDKNNLHAWIGNIPQDDLLIEELTVYQNLFFSAKLYFGKLSDEEINKKVNECLISLGLYESKDLAVGDPLNKFISGGQRKRLNIALELIRQPEILFVDEPTSGLSSNDAENVMELLKQLSLSGKLVFVVIHQPSSDIFKLFDKLLLLDTGGYPVFYGNPIDSLSYFKQQMNYVDFENSECIECGNINPEENFRIIESKTVDEFGKSTADRKISSSEWYKLFNTHFVQKTEGIKTANNKISTPVSKVSNTFIQYLVYFKRNFLAKINNKQYLAITLIEGPLLALILAVALRAHSPGEEYRFGTNPNIPVYIFICAIVALFLGLIVSAEEIIHDKKILKRESFLRLSRSSYLFSKITFLFIISAIQTVLFLIVGNLILNVSNLFFDYWIVLFSVSCFANVLGLNISSGLKTRVAVYILIPFLVIPQIMLSGVMVKFEDLSPVVSSQSKVPFIGNIMASRWAFEALAVDQFKNNDYEKPFFEYDKQMSNATYRKDWWPGVMQTQLRNAELFVKTHKSSSDSIQLISSLIKTEFSDLQSEYPKLKLKSISDLEMNSDPDFFKLCYENMDSTDKFLIKLYNQADGTKQQLLDAQVQKMGEDKLMVQFRENHYNEKLEEYVKNTMGTPKILIAENKIIRRFEPVFYNASTKGMFSAPFFSYSKSFLGVELDTFWFNLIMIWIMTISLYITLYFDLLRKLLER